MYIFTFQSRLRYIFLVLLIVLVLILPFFLINSNSSTQNTLDRIPFIGYTEVDLLYDENGNLVQQDILRTIGSEKNIAELLECLEQFQPSESEAYSQLQYGESLHFKSVCK